METRKISLVVVDHNQLVREGLALLIRLQPDMELIAAAATAEEAVELYREHRPDVTLIDLDLPDGGGIRAIEQIRTINPSAPVLGLMTYQWDESAEKAAVRAGARSCIAKSRLNAELVWRIREQCALDS